MSKKIDQNNPLGVSKKDMKIFFKDRPKSEKIKFKKMMKQAKVDDKRYKKNVKQLKKHLGIDFYKVVYHALAKSKPTINDVVDKKFIDTMLDKGNELTKDIEVEPAKMKTQKE